MTEVIHLRRGLGGNPPLCGAASDPDVPNTFHKDVLYLLMKTDAIICPRCSELLPMQELSELSL